MLFFFTLDIFVLDISKICGIYEQNVAFLQMVLFVKNAKYVLLIKSDII